MNIETVNELIASLESAGELSIREQKFLKLAKEFRICSASLDTVIKTGNVLADQNSQLAAENLSMRETIEAVRGVADNSSGIAGWHLNGEIAQWSEILPEIDDIETPATDAYLAGIKADGVESGIKAIMTMLNHQAPGVSDAINVLRVHSSELREGVDK
ncbi:hypothetical protein [Klebsiella pneumoniae]|uniref:hypothetical protein n=1 Tax=Klebsiella pneumoniae TaxID=573 RepID=UPI000E2C7AF9|nr:hypothetical protein [Klebsiella pneumoniae]SVY08772.1 Uncharacterised protein [Klebsiella pneumoniae]